MGGTIRYLIEGIVKWDFYGQAEKRKGAKDGR